MKNKFGTFYNFFILGFMMFAVGCCLGNKCGKPATFSSKRGFVSHLTDSIVGLPRYDADGEFTHLYCTGFFIDKSHIMTARHCLIDMEQMMAVSELMGLGEADSELENKMYEEIIKGQLSEIKNVPVMKYNKLIEADYMYGVIKSSPIETEVVFLPLAWDGTFPDVNDVAILEVKNPKDYSKHWLKFATALSEVNEPVLTISMISKRPWYMTRGFISKIQKDAGVPINIIANIAIFPGSSGSPLIDTNGDIIGVTSYTDLYTGSGKWQIMPIANFVALPNLKRFYKLIQ